MQRFLLVCQVRNEVHTARDAAEGCNDDRTASDKMARDSIVRSGSR
jgi:hypothetical protein